MSLVELSMTRFQLLNAETSSDGQGGETKLFGVQLEFDASAVYNGSSLIPIADSEKTSNNYTIITHKDVVLKHPMIVRRIKDGKLFLIVSDGEDNNTPKVATLNMRAVQATEMEALP